MAVILKVFLSNTSKLSNKILHEYCLKKVFKFIKSVRNAPFFGVVTFAINSYHSFHIVAPADPGR